MEYFTRLDNLLRVVMILTLVWLKITLVDSQNTVYITPPDLTPNIGTNDYQLQCNIDNFQPAVDRALLWTKNGQLISWNNDIQSMFTSEFNVREQVLGSTTFYTLTISQVGETHGGVYKCLVADGQPTSYTEVASAQVNVIIPYFPPEGNPMCSPTAGTIVVEGSPLLLSCTSLPGYPDEVNIFLQEGTTNTVLSSSSQIVNNLKRIDYQYTQAVTLADDGLTFTCTITGTGQYAGMTEDCTIGPLEVVSGIPLITPSILNKSVGEDAMFTCTLSTSGTIQWDWYTEPATQETRYTTSPISGGQTFTLVNVQQLTDNGKVVVCKATLGGVDVEGRATLNVIPLAPQPTTKAATTKQPTTAKVTQRRTNPPVVVPGATTPKTQPPVTDVNSVTTKTQTPASSPDILTTKTEGDVTFGPNEPANIIIIAIAAVGGLVFILIIVIIIACICCYSRRPKPVVIADDKDSFSDSEASWEARADGAMTRKSRVIYRNTDAPDDPPPRRPHENRGYDEDLAPHLLKIPDGLSTVSGSTMSPSLAYAMEYLNQPEDPMKDDMSSAAFTDDSRNGLGDERFLYSQGPTDFGGGPPRFDPAPPGTQGYDYPDSEMNESGTFVKRMYDSVPQEYQHPKEQEPDMPTYALPHRDRINKVQNVVYNPNAQNVPDIQINHDINRKRQSSIPYVNTAFGYDEGMVQNQIYQPGEHSDMQYF
ncbi:uncharacterized protein [Amphiura filiformis]|uniref:uncharacterized protein n=1 Tax=Amphiura filiformis TaxID=82378 RepID=UPI003B224587